jgi:hypothetical protein
MAELDPEKVGRLGVDPTTGSPLSQEVRNALLRKSTIDSATFRNEMSTAENKRKETDIQNIDVIRNQEKALLGFSSNLQSLRTDIGKLGTGLASIALLLQQDGLEEQNKIKLDQENQRRLTERQIRIGKENEIEEKIQNALAAPVQNIAPKVSDTFEKIGAALGILFGGWLTKQVVDAIKASEEGNTTLFNNIKWNIIKNLGIVAGGLFAIKKGFGLVMRTIGGIGRGLTRLLIAKPLAIAAALLPKGIKPGGGPSSGKGPGGGGPGLIGGLINGLTGWMNWMNGEKTDAILAALTFVPGGGIFRGIRAAAGAIYTIDQIAELFKLNLTGVDPKILEKKKKEFEDAKRKEESKKPLAASTKPTPSTPPSSAPTPVKSSPQETMMGQPAPSAPSPAAPATETPAPVAEQPSAELIKKFEMAWQYRNNSFARGRIEGEWEKLTPEQKRMAIEWAKMKGYNWSEMKLQAPATANVNVNPAEVPAQMSSSQQTAIEPKPAQMTPVSPIESKRVGELPEAKPSLTMIKTSSGQNQQSNVPLTSGALSDVPLINSANPDNFYVLYSQLSYNVVI